MQNRRGTYDAEQEGDIRCRTGGGHTMQNRRGTYDAEQEGDI